MTVLSKLATVEDSLAPYIERLTIFWQRLPQERLRMVLCALLLLWLMLSAVQLLWTVLGKSDPSLPPADIVLGQSNPQQAARDSSVDIDMERVRSWQLFGSSDIAPAEEEVVAPEAQLSAAESNAEQTRLQIKLQGVIQTNDESAGRAIISYQGKQDHYAVGDELPVSNQVVLRRLLPDRVLIANRGKIEALYLFDKSASSASPVQSARVARAKPAVRAQRVRGTDLRQRLLSNPSSLMELVRISEARKNGEIVGYKVRPGKDKSRFQSMGFENNDVVTSINGITLDNPSSALQVFQMMRTAKEATFELQRAGEPVSLVVNLDEPIEDEEEAEQ
ncbi:MAG: type II secretion system protein GspC [Pseudomonadales bacterium]